MNTPRLIPIHVRLTFGELASRVRSRSCTIHGWRPISVRIQPDVAATFAAAAAGDGRAVAAIAAMVDALGRAIAGMITVLVPERVVVGGGVAEAGAALFDPLRTAVDRHVTLVDHGWYEVVPASLGPHAGAIGAALWAAEPSLPTTPSPVP